MRIRKRKIPLPISLLSPVPLSDPHLFSRSPVTLQVQDQTATTTTKHGSSSQPLDHLTSDLHPLIDDVNSSGDHHHGVIKSDPLVKKQLLGCCLEFKLPSESMEIKSNDASNVALGAAAASDGPSSLPNHGGRGLWCDQDKAIPLKKRRGSFKGASAILDMKSELEIDCTSNEEINDCNDGDHGGEEKKTVNVMRKETNNNGKKGGKRGNTIMEGSRCSRVNGRGWRCCQPTLVGYSLCEHHLGKGRLRSMSSVRGRPSVSKKVALGVSTRDVESSPLLQLCEAAKEESEALASKERKASSMVKTRSSCSVGKKMKLGVVKARSLSSLLGQTTTTTSTTNL